MCDERLRYNCWPSIGFINVELSLMAADHYMVYLLIADITLPYELKAHALVDVGCDGFDIKVT